MPSTASLRIYPLWELFRIKVDKARIGSSEALVSMESLEMASFSGCELQSIEPLADNASLRLAYFGRNDLIDVSLLACKTPEEFFIVNNHHLAGHTVSLAGISLNRNVHTKDVVFHGMNRTSSETV